MIAVDRTQPWHQTNWDWRAAMHFMFGGAGSGLMVAAPAAPQAWYPAVAAAGAFAIAVGLFFVWLEIGRPFRALNVLVHARTSWMTRESWASLGALCLGILAAIQPSPVSQTLAALAGGFFLYCQGRILTAAKGIPAWRLPIISPLVLMTGFLEGMALLVFLSAPLTAGLLLCVAVRAALWRRYRGLVMEGAAPEKGQAVLKRHFFRIELTGTVVPAGLLLFNLSGSLPVVASIAAVFAFAGGWLFKFILLTRLGFNQGFAVPKFPHIGGAQDASSRPGWPSC